MLTGNTRNLLNSSGITTRDKGGEPQMLIGPWSGLGGMPRFPRPRRLGGAARFAGHVPWRCVSEAQG